MCMFSLITVCLNPGEKLRTTLNSALEQTCGDFEILVKDGGSRDGSLEQNEELFKDPRIRVYNEKDTGIYDAMNQAVSHARGQYVFFLNCGDRFCDPGVLERTARAIRENGTGRDIFYGNVFWVRTGGWIIPPGKITGFTCYRNVPCHQACFYSLSLCREKPFETKYKIRGDYEHFLWCFYRGNAKMHSLDFAVAEYEGGGYSETKENLKKSDREHREITALYMTPGERFRYRAALVVTLAPLRRRLSESRLFSAWYNGLVGKLYRRK